jgi:hypothetical protein
VLETAIRDAMTKLDAPFGYADGFDEATGRYRNLVWEKIAPELFSPVAILVRAADARAQTQEAIRSPLAPVGHVDSDGSSPHGRPTDTMKPPSVGPDSGPRKPQRFYGSVEIDMVRPVKSFDTILNAVAMELLRTHGARVKITLEIEGEAPEGFAENEVSIVRDNAKQLKFRPESTGFED